MPQNWSMRYNEGMGLRLDTMRGRAGLRGRIAGWKNRLLRCCRMPEDVIARLAPEGGALMDGATATATAPAGEAPTSPGSLAKLFSTHILRDGEIILLALKPSIWYVVLSGLRFIAIVILGSMVGRAVDEQRAMMYVEIGVFLVAGRLVWSLLQWMGRLYILTDMRILSLSGIFTIEVFDCPLRKVARARMIHVPRERLLRLGTLEIIPCDEAMPSGFWLTIRRPGFVHQQVLAAIRRAKHPGMGFKIA